jgi:beta-phosphoglucomutase-like phosphatase (HAD superfamily)
MTVTGSPALELTGVTTLLCDADGTLFPSEDPAYVASAVVTRDFAARYGLEGDFSPEALRRVGVGRNFRATAEELLHRAGIAVDRAELDEWVDRERTDVTAHLRTALGVDPQVVTALDTLRDRFTLAIVTSSAAGRVAACCTVTGVDRFFTSGALFSAEDSLPTPVSKPDPAVYLHALDSLGITADAALAIEDSVTGTRSAVAAGIRTIGLVEFVPPAERPRRTRELLEADAVTVVASWAQLTSLLSR